MRRLLFIVVAGLMLAVVGCSSSPSAGSSPSPAQPSAATSNPTPAATPSSTPPDANCLNGRYDLIRFAGVGAMETFGTGEGGDVTSTFDNGSYLLSGAGKDPIKMTVAGQTVDLLVDGTISGDYRVVGKQATFTVGESTGSATLGVGPLKDSVPMEQVGSILATNGDAGLACANDTLIVTLQDVRLEFGRV
jgi:hypothetical protein